MSPSAVLNSSTTSYFTEASVGVQTSEQGHAHKVKKHGPSRILHPHPESSVSASVGRIPKTHSNTFTHHAEKEASLLGITSSSAFFGDDVDSKGQIHKATQKQKTQSRDSLTGGFGFGMGPTGGRKTLPKIKKIKTDKTGEGRVHRPSSAKRRKTGKDKLALPHGSLGDEEGRHSDSHAGENAIFILGIGNFGFQFRGFPSFPEKVRQKVERNRNT